MKVNLKLTVASIMWCTAALLMISHTTRGSDYLLGWSLLIGIVAMVPTGWLVIEEVVRRVSAADRIKVEELAEAMATALHQECDVVRLRK